jgi:uncharacterized protein YebE (UPF0316 family)
MWIQALILSSIGIFEEFINLLYYSMVYRQFKYACGIFSMIRVFIWYYVLRTIISDIDNLYLIFFYAGGGAIGDWLSLTVEPHLERKIVWLHKILKKRKGRKKKGWFIFQAKKIKK